MAFPLFLSRPAQSPLNLHSPPALLFKSHTRITPRCPTLESRLDDERFPSFVLLEFSQGLVPAIFRPGGGIAWNSSKKQLGEDIETFDSIHVGITIRKYRESFGSIKERALSASINKEPEKPRSVLPHTPEIPRRSTPNHSNHRPG